MSSCSPAVNDIVYYATQANGIYWAKVKALHANDVIDLWYGGDPPSQHVATNVPYYTAGGPAPHWACQEDITDANPHF